MNYKEVLNQLPKDYKKQATRDLTVFTTSIFGETYVISFKELFDIEFSSILWVIRNRNMMTFYRSDKDHELFREIIGKKCINKEFSIYLVKELKNYTDWFNKFLVECNNLDLFILKREMFINNYRKFFAFHQAVCWGSDYLLEHHSEMHEIIKALGDVYAYNERVVPDVEKYLMDLGIDHFHYYETDYKGDKTFRDEGLFFSYGKKEEHFFGDELNKVEGYIVSLDKIDYGLKELKGTTTCLGKVRGVVKNIKDVNQLHLAKPEDILVTGMTRPQFNHILKNCRAIVCNEGNILSHAAILTREFNIPCIVGTKNATEIFQNGDFVEVDADNGIVRKLN